MISGAGDWLLVLLIFFGDGAGMTATKRFPAGEQCQDAAIEISVKAGSLGAASVSYVCTELHGRDPVPVLGEAVRSLKGERVDEGSVSGY